jgi:hypothetical protein
MRSLYKFLSDHQQRNSILIIVIYMITACTSINELTPEDPQINLTKSPAPTQNPHITEIWIVPEKGTPVPTPTISPLDMVPTIPEDFNVASGEIQFVEFFRFG